tara:strand:- start:3367 stop:3564 length:198 start_codon:yes stop_codon:yes gene_type:complete
MDIEKQVRSFNKLPVVFRKLRGRQLAKRGAAVRFNPQSNLIEHTVSEPVIEKAAPKKRKKATKKK